MDTAAPRPHRTNIAAASILAAGLIVASLIVAHRPMAALSNTAAPALTRARPVAAGDAAGRTPGRHGHV
jgi:hypothetical protein